MSQQQEEIASLLKQIGEQDELITKLEQEQQKLASYILQFKHAMQQRTIKQSASTQKNAVDQQKVEKQLQKQLENAKTVLKNYQHQLKNIQKKNAKNKFSTDDLMELQNTVKSKEQKIKDLHQEIKNLGIVKRRQEKLIDKKEKNEDGIKLSKLVQEVRKQREQLQTIEQKHKYKRQTLQKRKMAVQQIWQQYQQKCTKYGEKPITFEEFKEKRIQRKRQQSSKKVEIEKKKDAKKFLSVKDIINSHLDIQSVQISEKGLIQLRQKKAVAQNSLKIAKKKHQKQIQELEERLQILRSENESLNKKYLQKKKEKQLSETSKNMNFKKNSSKTTRKLEPII